MKVRSWKFTWNRDDKVSLNSLFSSPTLVALTCHAWLCSTKDPGWQIPGQAVIYSCLLSLGRMENGGIISNVHPQYRSWSLGPTAEDLQKRASDLCQGWHLEKLNPNIFFLLITMIKPLFDWELNVALMLQHYYPWIIMFLNRFPQTLQIVPPPNTCHWLSRCCCARLVEMFIQSKKCLCFSLSDILYIYMAF